MASWPRALRLAQRYDVVYLNGTVCGRLLPALRGVRTVLHVHDMVDRVPRHWRRPTSCSPTRRPSPTASTASTPTSSTARSSSTRRRPSAPWPHGDGGPVVGFVGRIEPRKGVLDLVAAAPAIRAARPARAS